MLFFCITYFKFYNFSMVNVVLFLMVYMTNNVYFDNLISADYMSLGFIHSQSASSSAYDNPAILSLLSDIYIVITECKRNSPNFYVETVGRSHSPLHGIISPKFALYYRKIYSFERRVDSPFFLTKERYSEYTLGLSSTSATVSIGLNLKYINALYAYADEDSPKDLALDFAKGFTNDIGISFNNDLFTISAAYNNVYGNLWWEGKGKNRLPQRYFFTFELRPLREILFLNVEYEKNSIFTSGIFKGGILLKVPYQLKNWHIAIAGGYLTSSQGKLLTYGFSLNKDIVKLAFGFDNNSNISITLYTQGK